MAAPLNKIGYSGLKISSNKVNEEYKPNLKGLSGVRTYRDMIDNDATIGAVIFAIKSILSQVKWDIVPASDKKADIVARDFVESCFHDMSSTWSDTLFEILSCIDYGWAYMEVIYKIRKGPNEKNPMYRSKHSDNRIGWRRWAQRPQDTLDGWKIEDDGVKAMLQRTTDGFSAEIPIEKALLFRTGVYKNNPEGRAILRSAYRSWFIKKNIEEIEAIGIERELSGFPVLKIPMEVLDTNNEEYADIRNHWTAVGEALAGNRINSLLMPSDTDEQGKEMYTLHKFGGGDTKRTIDTTGIINRLKNDIASSMLADFIILGQERVGSYALSTNKTTIFQTALKSILDNIADVINRYAIARLMSYNSFPNTTDIPKLVYSNLASINLAEFGNYLKALKEVGVISDISDDMKAYTLDIAKIPHSGVTLSE